MKKYSWLLALLCVIALLFTLGCSSGGGGKTNDTTKKEKEKEEKEEGEHIGKTPAVLWDIDNGGWEEKLGIIYLSCDDEDGEPTMSEADFIWPKFKLAATYVGYSGYESWDAAFQNLSDASSYSRLKITILKSTGSIASSAEIGWGGLFYNEDGDWIDYDPDEAALDVVLSNQGSGTRNLATITFTLSEGSPDSGTVTDALKNFSGVNAGGFVDSSWSASWGAGDYEVQKIWFE